MNNILFRRIDLKLSLLFALTSVLVVLILQLGAATISLWQSPTKEQVASNLVVELDERLNDIKSAFAHFPAEATEKLSLLSQLAESIYASEIGLNQEFEADFSYDSYISTLQTLAFYDSNGVLLEEFLCPRCENYFLEEGLIPDSEIETGMEIKFEPGLKSIATPSLLLETKTSVIVDDEDQTVWLHYPVKDTDDSKILGHVFVQVFVPSVESLLLPMLADMYLKDLPEVLLFSLLVGGIIGSIVSRIVIKRILDISRIASSWAQGNLSLRINDSNQDELNGLANDMNTMAEDLQRWVDTRETLVMQEERTRVARDLHDTVKQKMFALQMQLSSAKQVTVQNTDHQGIGQQTTVQPFIDQALQLVRDSQEDLKSIIYAMRPIALEQKGLILVMQDYIQQWQARTGICVESDLNIKKALSATLEDTLYNIFQELMANIERHAQAMKVNIILSSDTKDLILIIEDDGIGFDNNSIKREGIEKSTGLDSIRERLNEQHGQLNMTQQVKRGTRVQVSIKLSDYLAGEK
jgi:signal transduction histidine kinase